MVGDTRLSWIYFGMVLSACRQLRLALNGTVRTSIENSSFPLSRASPFATSSLIPLLGLLELLLSGHKFFAKYRTKKEPI